MGTRVHPRGYQGVCSIKAGLITFIATGGYSGFAPIAPGTFGSAVGLGIFLGFSSASRAVYTVLLVGCILVGLWTAGEAERLLGTKDASPIVIDEIAGMLLTYYGMPVSWWTVLLGFLLFRVFDIVKPVPQLEDLPGGWGIMLDDLCAGLLAHGCLRLSLWLGGW